MAVRRGEVFGLLGPNGAGKTTTLHMLVGFLEPTAGSATVEGLGITESMNLIYSLMGVCPQHNLLWATLTGVCYVLVVWSAVHSPSPMQKPLVVVCEFI